MSSCLIIAGEKSGEEHSLTFFPELKKLCPDVSFYGVGGDELKENGLELLYHLKDFSSMGFSDVIQKIPFYFSALKKIHQQVLIRKTKVAILIDFQDFNMKLAEKLKKSGVKVLYYVAPQAWAWKAHRVHALSRNVHTLFTILPFEKKWFEERGVRQVRSIPHPLMLSYQKYLAQIPVKNFKCWENDRLKILLLPGSRKFEVKSLLPEFIKVTEILKKTLNVEVHLVKVKHIESDCYEFYKNNIDVWYESEDLISALKVCHFSLAASGTVTLSCGLFEIPTIVCYKTSLLNEFIFYNFINYQGPISLTNIIHQEMVFPEFKQNEVEAIRIAECIKTWTSNTEIYNQIKAKLKSTKEFLSGEIFSVPKFMAQVLNEYSND